MDVSEVTSVSHVPDVKLVPHVDADIAVVISAADHVEELLPHPVEPVGNSDKLHRGFAMRDHLDPFTFEQMKALMKAAV